MDIQNPDTSLAKEVSGFFDYTYSFDYTYLNEDNCLHLIFIFIWDDAGFICTHIASFRVV